MIPLVLWAAVGLLLCAAGAVVRDLVRRFRRSERKLHALLESMDDLILVHDRKGTYVEILPSNEKLLVLPKEQLIGRTMHEVLPREIADAALETIETALASGRSIEVDYRLSVDGHETWFTGKVTPLENERVLCVVRDCTARKVAEQELAKRGDRAEGLYRDIVEQAQEVIFTLAPDGTITSLNPAFETTVGWPVGDWIGRHFLELICPTAREEAARMFAEAAVTDRLPVARAIVRGRDERRVVFEASLVRQIVDGRFTGYLGFARDITRREQQEKKLRNSERQLAEAEKIAKLGTWQHDFRTNALTWSDEHYRLFGLDPAGEPITFERFLSLLTPEMADRVIGMQPALLENGIDEWELRVEVEGVEKLLHCRVSVARDSLGRPISILGTAQDVTAMRLAERQLRESDERFQLLARATNDVMWDWDLINDTIWWNEGMCTRFGYGPQESSQAGFWSERMHPDDRQRILDAVDEALGAGASVWEGEYRFRKADDTYASVLDRGYIVRGEDLVPLRMVGAMMDVTERRQMQERLAQATRVSSLGRIATSIAHEFNNVLMGIQPNLEVVRRRAGTDLSVPVGHILQSVKRGKRITEEILRFTRPATLALQCVDVTRFLEGWQNEITPMLGRNINLVIDAENNLFISADPQQFTQVLTNLAVNARDAINGGEGQITVTVSHVRSYGSLGFATIPTADRFIHFAVTDTGSGMSKDQLAHVFEPLFTTKKAGTGLGLAVSYQIVASHDGYISAESVPGEGTTFHILIPETLPMLDELQAASHDLPSSARVLIVEDESAVSAGICALLELEGMQTRVVDTGAAAVPAAEEFSPDAVILDIGLPDMNGIDVYARLYERWPRLPVLFSSGHVGAAKLDTYLARENVGLVVKPYDLATLRGALGTLLHVH